MKVERTLKSGSQFFVWNQIQKKCENTVKARLSHLGCECRTATENRASLYHWRDGQQNTVIRMKAKCQTSCFFFTSTCASHVFLLQHLQSAPLKTFLSVCAHMFTYMIQKQSLQLSKPAKRCTLPCLSRVLSRPWCSGFPSFPAWTQV